MHQKRKDGNVKKLQENTKSMYALKSKYNVYRMIKSDPGSIESIVSFGIFSRLIRRKKQFVYQRDIPDTSYLCEACENPAMMAKVIRKKKSCHPTNPTILSKNSCVIQMIQNA